jgi:hypothetical protein
MIQKKPTKLIAGLNVNKDLFYTSIEIIDTYLSVLIIYKFN